MKGILKIEQLPNGAHQNQLGQFENIPDGWAVIPDDMELPASFPFVGVEVEEVTHYRENMVEREVTKTREVEQYREVEVEQEVTKTREVPVLDEEGQPTFDEEGNPLTTIEEYTEMETVQTLEPVTVTEEYTEMEVVTEKEPYTVMTVTSMTEGVMPEPAEEPEPGPTIEERVAILEDSNAEMTEALDMILAGVTE